jgi:hypothetical protein
MMFWKIIHALAVFSIMFLVSAAAHAMSDRSDCQAALDRYETDAKAYVGIGLPAALSGAIENLTEAVEITQKYDPACGITEKKMDDMIYGLVVKRSQAR